MDSSNNNNNYWRKKIQHAFHILLKTICGACYNYPIAMFINNPQWVDASSMELLLLLFSNKNISNLMFVGSGRLNKLGKNYPWRALIIKLEKEQQHNIAKASFDSAIELLKARIACLTKEIQCKDLDVSSGYQST